MGLDCGIKVVGVGMGNGERIWGLGCDAQRRGIVSGITLFDRSHLAGIRIHIPIWISGMSRER